MATQQKDLTQLQSIVSHNIRFFYEVDKDGNKVLKHILVGSSKNILEVPTDGITIDVVPPDSVGTEQIEDGSILRQDLHDDVRGGLVGGYTDDDETLTIGE